MENDHNEPVSPASSAKMRAKGLTLVFAQILPVMAIVTLFPAIPHLFRQFGGEANAKLLVPMIVTIPSLCVAIFAPFAGGLADRFGRRPVFVGSLALYVLAGAAPLLLNDLRLIVASRALLGVAEAGVIAVSSALIGDYFGEQRYRWASWVGIATSIAGTLLIASGGALVDLSWRAPFAIYLAAIPIFIAALVLIDEPARTFSDTSTRTMAFPWRAASLIGAVTLLTSVLYYVEPLHLATILTDLGAGSATRIGLIQAVTSLGYILGAFVYRRLHARPVGQLLGLAGLLMGAGNIVLAIGPTELVVSLGAFIQQTGAGMIIPLLLAWGQSCLPLEQRGRGMGIWATAFFAGLFLCPPLVASVGEAAGGLRPAVLALAVATLVIALLAPIILGRVASSKTSS